MIWLICRRLNEKVTNILFSVIIGNSKNLMIRLNLFVYDELTGLTFLLLLINYFQVEKGSRVINDFSKFSL